MMIAANLSYVGTAALTLLQSKFSTYESRLWDVTSNNKIIGDLQYTPKHFWDSDTSLPLPDDHSNWFADKLGEIIGRTTQYCDLMSLAPPDDYFVTEIRKGLATIVENRANNLTDDPIIIRIMFGDFDPTKPMNVTQVLYDLIDDVVDIGDDNNNNNINIWVGAWRNSLTWNHAKLIAVDGYYLHTGGHNLWTSDYLQESPVHDLSFEVEGQVAYTAHYFANEQWEYLQDNIGVSYTNLLTDFIPNDWHKYIPFIPDQDGLLSMIPPVSNGFVAKYPPPLSAAYDDDESFPPMYTTYSNNETKIAENDSTVPMISMGKLGTILDDEPSEEAFIAMFDSSTLSIKLAIQDIGPRKICRDQPVPLIGFAWPTNHLQAFGRALVRGVDVSMILSNLGAFDLGGYSNGWNCNDVAAEILKTIPIQYPDLFYTNVTEDDSIALNKTRLLDIAMKHLRIGFLRGTNGNKYSNGNEMALHTKHFIIDDIAAYIGSENIYSFDLAEWGVLVDDEIETKKMIDQVWNPLYNYSYTGEDCDLSYVVENMLEVPERTILEDFDSMLECFDIDINTTNAEELVPALLNMISELGQDHVGGGNNETTMTTSQSPSPTTATPSPTTAKGPVQTPAPTTAPNDDSSSSKLAEIHIMVILSLGLAVSSLF